MLGILKELLAFRASARELTQAKEEIVALKATINELTKIATVDPLTGLLNLRGGNESLTSSIAEACRTKSGLGITMIDLDHFKRANDTHGHAMGDAVLKGFAGLLQSLLRTEDVKVRKGGDEFFIVLKNMSGEDALQAKLNSIGESVAAKFKTLGVTASIGGVFFDPADLQTSHEAPTAVFKLSDLSKPAKVSYAEAGALLLAVADAALYKAKELGRNRMEIGALTDEAKRDIRAVLPGYASRRDHALG